MADEGRSALIRQDLPRWAIRVGMASWYFIGFCGALVLLAVILTATRDITIPLILGIVLAVIFNPLTKRLTGRWTPPSIAAALVVLLILGVTFGSAVIIGVGVAEQGDELAARTNEAVAVVRDWLEGLNIDATIADRARESVNESVGTVSAGLAHRLVGAINSAVGIVTGTILGLIVLYYLLKDGSELVDRFIDRQRPGHREQIRRISDRSAHQIQAYARGRTVMAVINGAAIGLAALVLGVPLAFAITLVNFIGAYIPYLGAFIGGAFAFLMALSTGGLELALAMVAVSLIVNLLLENALEPILLGEHLEMHPLLVLLATVLGGLTAGMVGLILAAPVTAIAINLYREIRATGFFDE